MRSALSSILAITMAAGSGSAVTLQPMVAQAAPEESPEQLYNAGRKAFRLGKYEEAVGKFEAAYAASDNALLLYNIGLAYRRWHGVSKNIDHLRKAKAVFQNFLLEAQRDPERLGDPSEAEQQLKEIEAELEQAEKDAEELKKKQAEIAAAERAKAEAEQEANKPKREGPDPGKKLRLGGVIAMGVGGAALLGGSVLGVVFGLKGREFKEELGNIRNDLADMNCDANPNAGDCPTLLAEEQTTIDNGRKANNLTVISLGVIGGVGLLGLGTGIGLFIYGRNKTRAWEKGRTVHLRAHPVVGRGFGGVSLTGRF